MKQTAPEDCSLFSLYVTFFKLGLFSFGGGYAMIPLIEREIVHEKQWISQEHITDIFSVTGCLPGAPALNSSAFVGYLVCGIPGAFAALLGNLTPSVFIVTLLSVLLAESQENTIIQAAFLGIRPAVVGLIIYAAVKIGKVAVVDKFSLLMAVMAFGAAVFPEIEPIPIILAGAIIGCGYSLIKDRQKSSRT